MRVLPRRRTTARTTARPAARTTEGRPGPLGFLARCAVGLVVLQLAFLGLLVAAQAVPNGPIIRELSAATRTGDYGASYAPDGFGGTADRFTECVELGYGVSWPGDPRSLWYRATGGPRLDACDAGRGEIRALARGAHLQPQAGYFRYWSGYSVMTRPVLATLGVTGVRLVTALLMALAGLAAFVAVRRRAGVAPAVALAVPLVGATNALAMPSAAFSHGIALAAVFAGVALTALATGRWGWRGATCGAGLSAGLFCYVDLLTTPPMDWSLCAAAAGLVLAAAGRRRREVLGGVVAAGAAWPVAFGVTWVSRWLIAALVQGPGVFSRVHDVASFRLDGRHGTQVSLRFGAATLANLRMWHSTTATAEPLVVLGLGVLLVALVVAVVRRGPGALATAAVLAAPALVVPAWYEVLRNHSQIHAFFTYTSCAAALGIVVAAALAAAARVPVPSAGSPTRDDPATGASPDADRGGRGVPLTVDR